METAVLALECPLPTRRSTVRLARALAVDLAPSDLVVLDGPLGCGKTFFTRALSRALGLDSRFRVTSPTFSLVNEYPTAPPLAHADLYRLGGAQEVEELGLRERRDQGWLIVAEWARPHLAVLGSDALVIEFSLEPRRAQLTAHGPRAVQLLKGLSEHMESSPPFPGD